MGRPSLYANREERAEARALSRARYEMTDRARSLRSAQNQRAYQSRKGSKTGTNLTQDKKTAAIVFRQLPRITSQIRALASQPIPIHSPLFRMYSRSTSKDDHKEFEPFINGPPFTFSTTLRKNGIWQLVDSLHGYQNRLHRSFDTRCVERLRIISIPVFAQELYSSIVQKLDDFRTIQEWIGAHRDAGQSIDVSQIVPYTDYCINLTMAEHYQQWVARRLIALLEDWKALKKGKGEFIDLYSERWSQGY